MDLFADNQKKYTNVLPTIDLPFYGESLIGYLLRLDHLNGFLPGSIIRGALKERHYTYLANFEYIESNINTKLVSAMLGLPEEVINNLKIKSIREKLYRYDNKITRKVFSYDNIKICPICIQEWKLPILFLFSDVRTCLIHGTDLIWKCSCGTKVNLFNRKYPLCCPKAGCHKPYTNMVEDNMHSFREKQSYIQFIYNSFLFGQLPLIKSDEKVIKGILRRVNFYDAVLNEGISYIKGLFGIKIINDVEATNFRTCLLSFDIITTQMRKLRLSPYQFLNIEIPDKYDLNAEIIEFGIVRFDKKNISKSNKQYINNNFEISKTVEYIPEGFKGNTKLLKLNQILYYYFNNNSYITGKMGVKSNNYYFTFNFKIERYDNDNNFNLLII